MKLALAFCLMAGLAGAQEFVTAEARLSDEDFTRLAACAAPSGGECQKPIVRWSTRDARDVSNEIVMIEAGYPAKVAAKLGAGLDATIAGLNGVGAGLMVSRSAPGRVADIRIFLLNSPSERKISGTGLPKFDGGYMKLARMQMEWRASLEILQCAIASRRDAKTSEVERLLIEEVPQCLGFLTDIGGRTYESRSIIWETSNARSQLGAQDAIALRRHYP